MRAKLLALLSAAVLAVSASGFAQPVLATTITHDLLFTFSGDDPSSATLPWLSVTYDDDCGGLCPGDNEVLVTFTAPNLTGTEYVSQWYINFDDGLDETALTITYQAGLSNTDAATVTVSENSLQADGDGKFDILFDFPNSNSGSERFISGETVVYLIISTEAITAASFDFFADTGGGQGVFESAAKINAIGQGSGWIATPIPAAAWLFGSALLGLIGVGRTRGRRARRAA